MDGVGPTNLGNIELSGGTIEFTKTLSNLANGFISGRGEFRGSTASPGGIGLSNLGVLAFSGGTTDIRGDVQNNAGGHIVNAGGGVLTFYDDVVHNGAEIRTDAGSRTVFFGAQSGAGPFTGTGTVEYAGDLRPGNSPANVTYEGDVLLDSSASRDGTRRHDARLAIRSTHGAGFDHGWRRLGRDVDQRFHSIRRPIIHADRQSRRGADHRHVRWSTRRWVSHRGRN